MSAPRRVRASEELRGTDVHQPTEAHRWRAPVGVRIEGDSLVYDRAATRARGGEERPTPGMLDGFLRLGDAAPEEIAEYAREYGVLGVCAHGDIYTACRRPDPTSDEELIGYIDNPSDHEALDTWRYYSRLAASVLDVAQKLRGPKPPRVRGDELAPLVHYGGFGMYPADEIASTAAGARGAVAAALTRWLKDGDAQLIVRWPPRAAAPEVAIGGDSPDAGLFTAMGLQLALACAAAEGLWRCFSCGRLHERARPPRPDQRAFCETCRAAGVPVKLANRARRARERGEPES